ncbi:MAG: hypothetical protein PUA83_03845 [Clostridiales bacterium]|nr:hypothetical protein [Clostridiales bacterium]
MPETKPAGEKEAVCISTTKVYDSCRSQDCLEDLRCYLTSEGQNVIDHAVSVKAKTASVLWTYVDVEPVPFNSGFYTIDARIFYRVTADAQCGLGRPVEIEGLTVYDKRAILFGSEGMSKSFSSRMTDGGADSQLRPATNLPTATVELVDPVVLSAKTVDACEGFRGCDCGTGVCDIPPRISECFSSQLTSGDGNRRLYVTLGQFSIIRLERSTQILIPTFDYCIPEKECPASAEGDACEMFAQFHFPTGEFFPPDNCPGR